MPSVAPALLVKFVIFVDIQDLTICFATGNFTLVFKDRQGSVMLGVPPSGAGITSELSQDYSTKNRRQGRIHEPPMVRKAGDKHDETSPYCSCNTHYEVHNRPVSTS